MTRLRRSGGPFFPTAPTDAGTLFASPSGGWTWFNDPRAISYNGYTYVGYLEGQTGDVAVRAVQESTLTVGAEQVLHAAFEVDDHDNPGLWIRPSDHKLVAFYSRHLGADYYMRVSTTSLDTDPDLSDGFASEVNMDSMLAGSSYTYANPMSLSNDDGAGQHDYLFYRRHVAGLARWFYSASSDEWATVDGNVDFHNLTYSKVVTDGVDRIDVAVSTHPSGLDDPENDRVYHLYRQNAAWRGSDGTSLGVTPFDKTDMTLVYDSGGDPVWIWDIAYDTDGHPCITIVRFVSDTDHRYLYAHYDGSWDVTEIVSGGTYIPTAAVGAAPIENRYSGGVVMDHEDASIIYASVGIGSNEWQLRRYVTADHGATFGTPTVLAGTGKNVRPSAVRGHGSEIAVVWMDGVYASYVDYEVGTSYASE